MRRGRRPIFTAAKCAELWRRYKAGESILAIERALGGSASSIRRVLQTSGGIAPAERCRSSRVLSLAEREEISRGIAAGGTIRCIARGLGRAVSTVSQEVSRMEGVSDIEPPKPMCKPGNPRVAQSFACSPRTGSCSGSLQLN